MASESLLRTLLCIDRCREKDSFRYKALGLEMKISKSRVSVLIDDLEEKGYVRRSGAREVRLLDKGEQTIASIKEELENIALAYSSLALSKERIEELSYLTLAQGSRSLVNDLTGLATVQ